MNLARAHLQVYIAINERGKRLRFRATKVAGETCPGIFAGGGAGEGRGGRRNETREPRPPEGGGWGGGEINEMSLNGLINIIARFINSPGV